MRIDVLRLSGFVECKDLELSFTGGFNIIVGGNGSGKTLCLWAMKTVFLGPGENPVKKAPETGIIEMSVTHGSRQICVSRDLAHNTVVLTGVSPEGEEETLYQGEGAGSAFEDAVNQSLGWTTVEQWLQFGVVPEGTLGDIFNLVGVRSVVEHGKWVLSELGEARANLMGDNNGHPGELDIINQELERKLSALANWEQSAQQREELHVRLHKIRKAQGEATRGADARATSYDGLVKLQELLALRDAGQEELAGLKKQRSLVKDLVEAVDQEEQSLENKFGQFMNAGTDLEDALQEWSELTTKLHDIQRRMHVARQALAKAPKGTMLRSAAVPGVGLTILGTLAALGAGVTALAPVMGVAMGAVGVMVVWTMRRSAAKLVSMRRQELIELEEENQSVEETLEEIKKAMGKMGDLGHPMAIRRAAVQYWKAREDVERLRARRDECPSLIEVVDAYENKVDALAHIEKRIIQLKAESPYLTDFDEQSRSLSGEVDMAKAQSDASFSRAERLGDDQADILRELERLSAETPPLGRLERERKELARRREQAARESESLAICLEVWQEALDAYRKHSQEQLASAVGNHFATFTDRLYTAVQSQGKDIKVKDESGEWIPAEALSDGTLEQLGMALRLAETDLSPGPLVLDNVFLRWDEELCSRARHALQEQVAAGVQVLLFTHNGQLSSWGDAVLALEGDSGSIQEAA